MANTQYPRGTALWLIQNTKLSMKQIADFCNLPQVEIELIKIDINHEFKAEDPIQNYQLTIDAIKASEADSNLPLKLLDIYSELNMNYKLKDMQKTFIPKPIAKHIPHAVQWLIQHISHINDEDIAYILKITKTMAKKHRHANVGIINPVTVGLCSHIELENLAKKYEKKYEFTSSKQ